MLYHKEVNIECADIRLLDSGIILLKYKPDFEIELKDVKEVEKVFIELSEKGNIYCLMDTSGGFNNFTNEAQQFLSKEASIVKQNKIKGSAVVIDNLPNRLLIKFFAKFFKPKFPMKVFSNQEDGLEWLESLMSRMSD